MSNTRIIDLDELVGIPKQVKLDGKVYTLPADLPVELYLKINHAAEQNLEETDIVELLYDELLKLFQYGDPNITALPFGVSSIVRVIPRIYGGNVVEDEATEDGARPTTPKTPGGSGGTRTRRKTATASRS